MSRGILKEIFINSKNIIIMKKVLLLACAAVMSLAANAQDYKQSVAKESLSLIGKMNVLHSAAAPEVDMSKVAMPKSRVAVKRVAHDGIYGLYIMDHTDYTGAPDGCDSIFVEKANVTEDGVTYNVKFRISGESFDATSKKYYNTDFSFYGKYDEAEGKITCPTGQVICKHFKYGDFALYAWTGSTEDPDNLMIDSENPITFTVEDGSINLDQAGFVYYMVDYSKQQGKDQFWTHLFNIAFKPANGMMEFALYNDKAPEGDQDPFFYYNAAVAVEDFGYNVNVYGFAPLGAMNGGSSLNGLGVSGSIQMSIAEDGKAVSMPAGQYVWPLFVLVGNSNVTEESGKTVYIHAKDGNYPVADGSGFVDGELAAGNQIYFQSVALFSNLWNDDGLKGYGMWTYKNTITLDEGGFSAAGISDATVSPLKKASEQCYNALGQRVNANAKGLIIRDGKKFFIK